MLKVSYFLSFCVLLFSCHSANSTCETCDVNLAIPTENSTESKEDTLKKGVDLSIKHPTLINVQLLDSTIKVELRYATINNFMKKIMYDSITELYLQKDVALKLSKAQTYLKKLYPTYSLLVYDGVRPLSVQQKMWDALDSIPVAERGKFLSNPKNGSVHNYGAAVDLTICDENGVPLDMGAAYDEIGKIAYPSLEQEFLQKGLLTKQHIENRKLLRKVMSHAGFYNIPSEWWHFNSCSREEAKKRYELVR